MIPARMMIDTDNYKDKRISWVVAPMFLWLQQKETAQVLKILTINFYPLEFSPCAKFYPCTLFLKIHLR